MPAVKLSARKIQHADFVISTHTCMWVYEEETVFLRCWCLH